MLTGLHPLETTILLFCWKLAVRTMPKETAATKGGRRQGRSICNFLLSLLEDKSYPHVQWTNEENGEFQIHWMHASSGAWEMGTDAETFRLWAMAKGKLKGRESNYKTWKANFRCAMKSRHELKEIKLPKDSPLKKKNLKFWRFKDLELVKRYKGGASFDWSQPQTTSRTRKSTTRVLRRRPNKKAVDIEEETESDEGIESEDNQPLQSYSDNCELRISSTTETNARATTATCQPSHEIDSFTNFSDDRLHIDMEEDSGYNPFGAGLLEIIERGAEKDSVVPSMPFGTSSSVHVLTNNQDHSQTENTGFHQCNRLPAFDQISCVYNTDSQDIFENFLMEQDCELFGDLQTESKVNQKGTPNTYFDLTSDDLVDGQDPFLYECIYTEL